MSDSQSEKLRAFLESRRKTAESEIVKTVEQHETSLQNNDVQQDEFENDIFKMPETDSFSSDSYDEEYDEYDESLEDETPSTLNTFEAPVLPNENSNEPEENDEIDETPLPPFNINALRTSGGTENALVEDPQKISKSYTELMSEKQEELDKEKEAQLKAYIHKRRKTVAGDDAEEDPYSGDAIARKNLRHLQKYLDREDIAEIKEIVINQPLEVGLEFADGHWEWIPDEDMTQIQLEEIARTLANKSGQLFHPGNPILSVKMPGGHRVQIVAGFNAPSGFVFSMRLQRKEKFGLEDFKMSESEREEIKELVRNQKTILISGGTGTGKTSFMNALIPSIPEDERLVTMEDVPELRLPHKNWARLIFSGSDTAMGDQGVIELLNACLRLRPDRIILGEIRKENAFAFCSAINTGHEGSMATIHANSPKMALDAVINRVMMNGDLPDSAMQVLRRQLIHDIYAVVQLTRVGRGVEAKLSVLEGNTDI